MDDEPRTPEERLAELRESGEAIGKLASEPERFFRVVEAFRAQDAERFQAELAAIDLIPRCRFICRWLCSKHCVYICSRFCGPIETQRELDVKEMLEFAQATARLSQDEGALKSLLDAIDRDDAEAWKQLVKRLELDRFCHQLCHWLCLVRCRLVCKLLCPPLPAITKVSNIPTSQFDAQGFASGPSFPLGYTPVDNKPAGVGDHPIAAWSEIRGVFSIAAPFQYKVEFATAPGGPYTPILQPIDDFRLSASFPLPPLFDYYTRVPDAAGWYNVSEIGLAGFDLLTNWLTPSVADGLYYLKLTVRTAALVEFASPIVPVLIDNTAPTKPAIDLQLLLPDGTRRDLGCCEKVERGNGNKIVIRLQAWDLNFSSISVLLQGGCGASLAIVDTGGNSLSKTYNGNTADQGYPVPTEFIWDPWAAKVDPCCYLIYVRIWDRVIANNSWSGGHGNENWHSITIA